MRSSGRTVMQSLSQLATVYFKLASAAPFIIPKGNKSSHTLFSPCPILARQSPHQHAVLSSKHRRKRFNHRPPPPQRAPLLTPQMRLLHSCRGCGVALSVILAISGPADNWFVQMCTDKLDCMFVTLAIRTTVYEAFDKSTNDPSLSSLLDQRNSLAAYIRESCPLWNLILYS